MRRNGQTAETANESAAVEKASLVVPPQDFDSLT
jgi:hypothetical protein